MGPGMGCVQYDHCGLKTMSAVLEVSGMPSKKNRGLGCFCCRADGTVLWAQPAALLLGTGRGETFEGHCLRGQWSFHGRLICMAELDQEFIYQSGNHANLGTSNIKHLNRCFFFLYIFLLKRVIFIYFQYSKLNIWWWHGVPGPHRVHGGARSLAAELQRPPGLVAWQNFFPLGGFFGHKITVFLKLIYC